MVQAVFSLSLLAVILFGPLHGDGAMSDHGQLFTGYDYVGGVVECWTAGDYSVSGVCEPAAGLKGRAVFSAMFLLALNSLLGLFSLIPVMGKAASYVSILVGGAVACFMLLFAADQALTVSTDLKWGVVAGIVGGFVILLWSRFQMRRSSGFRLMDIIGLGRI